jgi:hypothetical protein
MRSPLGQPIEVHGARVGNRFCILPMADGTPDGEPTSEPRWRPLRDQRREADVGREAVAVRHDGRATCISC